jgi:signal peptide peptidase SppA
MIFWAGDETSWTTVTVAEQKVAEGQKQGRFLSAPRESDLPPLWEKVGSTGVVSISGSLVNGSSGWMRMFGVTGYDDMLSAARAAAADPEVGSLLFKVSSPGGHVHGLAEFSAEINKISQTKPSMVYVPDMMASAAYWSGSSVAGPIMMASTAEVGSLGVLQVQRNISKQLAMDGIEVTIHRSGDLKAGVNPVEPISPEAKAHLDSQLADLHGMFKTAVKRNRPGMDAATLAESTRGQTFRGKRALDANLADSIGSFELALKLLDKSSRKKDTSPNSKGAAMHMTPEQLLKYNAALASGLGQAAALAAAGVVVTPEYEATLLAAEADAKKAADDAAAAQKAADDAAAAEAAKNAAGAVDTGVVDLLKSQLATAQASVAAVSSELAALKATTQSQTAAHEGLLAIARTAVANMLIPLGASASATDAMDGATVIAEHARVKTLFEAKFPVGGRSKPTEPENKAATSKIDPAFKHVALAAQANVKK